MIIIDRSSTKRCLYCLAILYITAYVIQIHQFVKLHNLESYPLEEEGTTTTNTTHQTVRSLLTVVIGLRLN